MINNIRKYLKREFQVYRYKKNDIQIKEGVNFRKAKFQGGNTIGKDSNVEKINLGYGSYIGRFSNLPRIKVGKYCSIGCHVWAVIGDHPINHLTTHPMTYIDFDRGLKSEKYVDDFYHIEVGNDVWIGDNVTIMNGIKIGTGAVIGAGTVVTKDVAPYSIVVGVPGKEMRKRFDEETIKRLLKTEWWNKSPEWINKNVEKFDKIEEILQVLENEKEQ